MIKRRQFLVGLGALFAAPAVCNASSLMQIRGEVMLPSMAIPNWCPPGWVPAVGRTVDRFQFPELHAWYKRTRQNGAHLGNQFRLPYSQPSKWLAEWERHTLDFQISTGNLEVPIVSVKPMRRPSGQWAQPGMMINYVVNAEVLKADNPDANRIHQEAKDYFMGRGMA
jgi:hypothetical protein